MRRKYGIAGSVMDDCYVMTCCAPCAWMQMAYVASHYGEAPMLCKVRLLRLRFPDPPADARPDSRHRAINTEDASAACGVLCC